MPYKNREDQYRAQKSYRVKIREKILEFLMTKACLDCGERDPIVLEFDHADPKSKFKGISKMLSGHYSWSSISREISKCEIRCANCHRRKSYFQFKCYGRTMPL